MTTSTFIYGDMDRISVIFASCDIRTDERTDKASYRDARTHLKSNIFDTAVLELMSHGFIISNFCMDFGWLPRHSLLTILEDKS